MDTPPLNRLATPGPAPRPAQGAAEPKDARDAARRAELREQAVEFEAMFLAEMFKHAGAGRATPGFDGGQGEAAFSSLLVNEQTRMMARQGGIGVADMIFESLLKRDGLE